MASSYSICLHSERDVVSLRWAPDDGHGDGRSSECSFQIDTSVVGSLIEYLSTPAAWRWSSAVNGWAHTDVTVLTIRDVVWRWMRADDGAAVVQVLGNVLDHGCPSAHPSHDYVLLATLTPPQITGLRLELRALL